MASTGAALTPEQQYRALAAVRSWQQAPAASVACPCCAATSLAIEDRSARPHAEWYRLACVSCGLDATLHIPMAPPHSP